MLRAWFYVSFALFRDFLLNGPILTPIPRQMASIITTRPIMFICAMVITKMKDYYVGRSCPQIQFSYKGSEDQTVQYYLECQAYFNGWNPSQYTLVLANYNGRPEQIGASLGTSFGMALWLAFSLHAIGIEIYLCRSCETSRIH
jgi:hypothetical protein